jgi:predicted DNA-binding protein
MIDMVTKLNRVVFYCPDELQQRLERLAKEDNRSLSNFIVTLLKKTLETTEQEDQKVEKK